MASKKLFCKAQFESHLRTLGVARQFVWFESGNDYGVGAGADDRPSYVLIDGQQYAVEVVATPTMEQPAIAAAAAPPKPRGQKHGAWGLWRRISSLLRRSNMRQTLRFLNQQLLAAQQRLAQVSGAVPKIVLIYDSCRVLEPQFVERGVPKINPRRTLASFQMVFITNRKCESQIVFPE